MNRRNLLTALHRWWDTSAANDPGANAPDMNAIDWPRVVPFIAMHAGCLMPLWVGWSPAALLLAVGLYVARMFFVTAFYHRYFSHRSFKTSRVMQFIFALLAGTAAQRGPLWWAGHHRNHHRHTDTPLDAHSPARHGLLWSHVGWFLSKRCFAAPLERVPDLAAYPELRWLDRFDVVMPAALATGLFLLGEYLAASRPELNTHGPQLLAWGFFVSTVVLYHCTFSINSLAHRYGQRRYATRDDSRNNLWLALLTLGEGWHNNHHHFPGSARQGFRWWEWDPTYYGLRLLAACGLIRDLRPVPDFLRSSA